MKRKYSEVEIEDMWRTRRVKINLWERLTYFMPAIYPSIVGLVMIFVVLRDKRWLHQEFGSYSWQFVVAFGFLCFAVFAWLKQLRDLKFVEIDIPNS